MSTAAIIGIAVAVVVVLVVIAFAVRRQSYRKHLRERFGPEYDRTVRARPRRAAEQELADREKRHERLEIKPLSSSARERYLQQWALVQEQFVDHPSEAVKDADRLVAAVMAERGYPADSEPEQRFADLSVRHSHTVEQYRIAHQVKCRQDRSQVSTEELREAIVRYRSLFEELVNEDAGHAVG
ncbi:hypothetical protein [Actinokineospora iranica]|uniref:Secreted protein n=1 Tax=Actinokineospora iranica TaxID=1271860 RepID=A0A1G6X1W0_9PSEU|nr:hypothetical protein [Actinokineospora iranica]SDD71296.1 hypothetical protein SAMN05216174_11633 [Actinokineospora iranica]